uniref:tRNA (pseudouridine(54)-N(1))-methyltransferase n=1 Tax=Thermofilum pendens TaxID=2269 RepID=A0A7C1PD26_THEPE
MSAAREYLVFLAGQPLEDKPLLSRIITSAFFLSHDIRRDVVLRLVYPEFRVRVSLLGARLRHVHVDEQSLSGVLRRAERAARGALQRAVSPHPGVLVEPVTRPVVSSECLLVDARAPWLSRELVDCNYSCFVISAGSSPENAPSLRRVRVTAFPKPADTTLVVLNIELDRICG